MGARGKKRKRADGSIASGKQAPLQGPPPVPSVEADQVREGLEALHAAGIEKGAPEASSPEWLTAYRAAQDRLQTSYPRMVADAILWRATFLDLLISRGDFQQNHSGDGELPTAQMLYVAGSIPTYGDETSFDMDWFEEMLDDAEAEMSSS